jgi:hypothetical protein
MSKLPRAWLVAGSEKTETKVSARVDMSADVAGKGLCPECRNPMEVVMAGGNKVWACVADRISLPMPDDE